MRFLGFVFAIVLVVGAVGYWRGWFSVTTSHASGKAEVTLGVDGNKVSEDTGATAARLGEMSAKTTEKVRSLGRKTGPDESELEGTLTAVDMAARDLTVTVSAETIDVHVPTAVPITRDRETVAFEQLRPTTRVRFTFTHAGDDYRLSRIEILR